MKVIEQLKKAQEVSLLIEAYEEELKKIPDDMDEILRDLYRNLEEAKKIFHEKELSVKRIEGEAEIEREKIKEKESVLEAGGLKSKELKALEDDIKSRKAHLENLESIIKKEREELEELQKRISNLEGRVKEIEEKVGYNSQRKKELEELIGQKKSELDALLNEMPADVKELFLMLKKIYQHEVVVPVEVIEEGKPKYFCSACSIQLSKSEIDSLKRDKRHIHTCPYCGRIIYFSSR